MKMGNEEAKTVWVIRGRQVYEYVRLGVDGSSFTVLEDAHTRKFRRDEAFTNKAEAVAQMRKEATQDAENLAAEIEKMQQEMNGYTALAKGPIEVIFLDGSRILATAY